VPFPARTSSSKPARLAGKLETFAERARIVHVDVDPAEINKNKEAHIPMCTTTKAALAALNAALDARPLVDGQYGAWVATLAAQREEFPMVFPARDDVIIPQRAIQACRHHRPPLVISAKFTMLRSAVLCELDCRSLCSDPLGQQHACGTAWIRLW